MTVGELLVDEFKLSEPSAALVERCLAVLGSLQQRRSIRLVEDVVQATQSNDVLGQAVLTAGDLAHTYPSECVGLMAWVQAKSTRTDHQEVAIAAIYAAVAYRRDPRSYIAKNVVERSAVVLMLEWADQVLADDLLPTQR